MTFVHFTNGRFGPPAATLIAVGDCDHDTIRRLPTRPS